MHNIPYFDRDRQQSPEQETGLRFSLAYEPIESKDILVEHPAGRTRIVEYPNPGRFRLDLREQLIASKLILGTLTSANTKVKQTFRVPISARPLAYDASTKAEGAFSYNDGKLARDLGAVLGNIAVLASPEIYVVRGEVGRSVAIVEFSQPEERRLFLVPGAEVLLQPLKDTTGAMAYYVEELQSEFHHRFDAAVNDFRAGFIDGTSENVT